MAAPSGPLSVNITNGANGLIPTRSFSPGFGGMGHGAASNCHQTKTNDCAWTCIQYIPNLQRPALHNWPLLLASC